VTWGKSYKESSWKIVHLREEGEEDFNTKGGKRKSPDSLGLPGVGPRLEEEKEKRDPHRSSLGEDGTRLGERRKVIPGLKGGTS